MIIASGITDSAIMVVVLIFLTLTMAFHGLFYWLIYSRVMTPLFKKVDNYSFSYWLIHLGLFALSCALLCGLLFVQYQITGKGILS